MKKMFIWVSVALALGACNDDDVATSVNSSVPLFQSLRVEYNYTQGVTYAPERYIQILYHQTIFPN